MKIITVKEFINLDNLDKVRALKSIAEGNLRIKENRKDSKNGQG